MTKLEKVVAVALRDEFCLSQKAFRMVCVDPDEVARVAVKAVAAFLTQDHGHPHGNHDWKWSKKHQIYCTVLLTEFAEQAIL